MMQVTDDRREWWGVNLCSKVGIHLRLRGNAQGYSLDEYELIAWEHMVPLCRCLPMVKCRHFPSKYPYSQGKVSLSYSCLQKMIDEDHRCISCKTFMGTFGAWFKHQTACRIQMNSLLLSCRWSLACAQHTTNQMAITAMNMVPCGVAESVTFLRTMEENRWVLEIGVTKENR